MKRINICLGVLVLVLVVCLSEQVSGAWAYFTTYTEARAIQTMDISDTQTNDPSDSNPNDSVPDINMDPDTYPPDGENPTNPAEPTNPEVSADSTTPTDPVTPPDPTNPTNPPSPLDFEDSTDPTTPAEPTPPDSDGPDNTELSETVDNMTKHITVYNKPSQYPDVLSVPVYVRIKAFAGKAYTLAFSDPDGKWTYHTDDGYYYYDEVLEVGETTSTLDIQISNFPNPAAVGDRFHVVVVKEVVPVTYRANGSPMPADWNAVLNLQ